MTVYESTAPRGGGVLVAALLMAMVTVAGLVTRPLLAIDETRYAAVALEMLQRGDWLVPHLNGETYSHKPPLLFWLVLVGWKLIGVSEAWARLVGPLAGVVALALVSRLAHGLWPQDARTRGWAPVITAGALVWASFGSLFMFDTLLACSALLGVLGIVHAVEHGRRRGVIYLALAITLGVLSKGPVILIHVLPVALAAPWWATPRTDRRWATWYLSLIGAILLGAGGALLWAIPAGVAGGPEYQQAIFLGQTAGRMTKSFAHRRAVWWYLPLLPAVLFPWFLWPESWRAARALRLAPRDAGVRFCIVWAAAGLLAFSLVSGKQLHYLLPLMPAMALLLARGLGQREAAPLQRPWLVATVIALLAVAVIVAGTTTAANAALWWPHDLLQWWWALLPVAAAVMLVAWHRGRITRNAAVHALATSTAVLLVGLQLAAARAATVPYDTTAMATAVRGAMQQGRRVAMLGAYNGEYHFSGRLQQSHIDLITAAEAPAWLRAHPSGLLLRYDRGRAPLVMDGIVARHPFRNGWATLSSSLPPAR
ncbi:MAG: glycosyltransferase family 39 protein [Gemmatimonadota bacterium]